MSIKRRLIILGTGLLVVAGAWMWLSRPSTPESEFNWLFGDMSVGTPGYQRLNSFVHPADAKGDYFSAEFIQSEAQFKQFVAKLGVSQENLVSSNGVLVKTTSKLNSAYPWHLQVKAEIASPSDKSYKIHVEGQQPYN